MIEFLFAKKNCERMIAHVIYKKWIIILPSLIKINMLQKNITHINVFWIVSLSISSPT